jgi:Mrp family chromosome partitioning ATPase
MAEMRAMFDYVLIDAPPVNLSNEAALLGQLSDGVVLVMEANSTRREAARKAKERLEAAKSHVLAAVLNNRTFPIPEGIYRRL